MSNAQLPGRPKRLLFIDDSPIATRDDQRKNRKAKSHTARVIWENQRKRRDGSKSSSVSGSLAGQARPARITTSVNTQSRSMPEVDEGYEDIFGPFVDDRPDRKRFNVLLKSTLSTDQLPSWFLAFSQSPIVYNCMSYAVGVYQESTGIATPKMEQQNLVHKGRTINLVNQALPDLDHADLEAVILGIFVLWRVNFSRPTSQETLLFRSYIPEANLITEFGKFDAIDAHASALHWLIDKAGGIDKIKLPGLALVLSNGDLLESTARCTNPHLPCMWKDEFATLDKLLPFPSPQQILATGFACSVPRGLPSMAQTTFQRVKRLDMILDLSHHRRLDDALFASLLATRNTVQYELLSLPKWQDLQDEERQGSQFATYETCRIAVLIYANAVLFPIPLITGWHLKLLDELRQILQMTNLVDWKQDTSALLMWSLAMASIAASRTIHRRYFRDTLKTVLLDARITTWSAMEGKLKTFLWTDNACGQGGTVLWESLGIDGFDKDLQ